MTGPSHKFGSLPCLVRSLAMLLLGQCMTSPVYAVESHALLVGVNNCRDFRLPGGVRPRPLRGAESDTQAVAELLQRHYGLAEENVRVMIGAQATHAAIKKAWQQIAARLGPEDQFIFYFAGHGTQRKDQRPLDEEDRLDEALCPADATANGDNLLADDELALWLDKLPTRRVTVILDCCHAGTGTKDLRDELAVRSLPLDQQLSPAAPQRSWRELAGATKSIDARFAGIYACQSFQQAYERRFPGQGGAERSGQLTHFLVKLLSQRQAAERLSVQEIADALRQDLDTAFNSLRPEPNAKQEPVLEASRMDQPLWSPR